MPRPPTMQMLELHGSGGRRDPAAHWSPASWAKTSELFHGQRTLRGKINHNGSKGINMISGYGLSRSNRLPDRLSFSFATIQNDRHQLNSLQIHLFHKRRYCKHPRDKVLDVVECLVVQVVYVAAVSNWHRSALSDGEQYGVCGRVSRWKVLEPRALTILTGIDGATSGIKVASTEESLWGFGLLDSLEDGSKTCMQRFERRQPREPCNGMVSPL